MNDPAKLKVDQQLFKNAPAHLQERLKVVRKELRAAARRQWRDNNLQEQPPRSTHEGTPER